MNSTNELRDYYVADEILRISSLSRKELIRELIDLKSKAIEKMDDYDILVATQKK